MVQPDRSSSKLPGYFQHICCQGLSFFFFFEIFIYTSLLFLEGKKSLPTKVGVARLPRDTALVTKFTTFCWSQQVPRASSLWFPQHHLCVVGEEERI